MRSGVTCVGPAGAERTLVPFGYDLGCRDGRIVITAANVDVQEVEKHLGVHEVDRRPYLGTAVQYERKCA